MQSLAGIVIHAILEQDFRLTQLHIAALRFEILTLATDIAAKEVDGALTRALSGLSARG